MTIEPFERIERAARWQDLFESLGDDALRTLARRFRELGASIHPDRHPHAARRAHEAFAKLGRLRDEAERALRDPEPTIIVAGRRTYRVGRVVRSDDVCDLHACSFDGGEGLLRVARSEADDDLVENEVRVLGRLCPRGARDDGFRRYLPRVVDTFRARFGGGPQRAIVLATRRGYVSLEDVRAAYPGGIDFRDAAWIFKRLLVGLGFVHRQGIVHGAILPGHVLVDPLGHGARIVSFCYAAEIGQRIEARTRRFLDLYAPEIAARSAATPGTDIFMAARTIAWLIDGTEVPPPLATFLSTCSARSVRRRPDDAWALHEELDVLLRRLVGPRAYRPLVIPRG